ncbi:MAG: hypothetical protein ABI351_05395, partial [Herbaspirillum sp.]
VETSKLEVLNRATEKVMWLLMLEAGLAGGLMVFIVWWTMFSGRKPDIPATPAQQQDEHSKDNESNT